MRSISSSDTRLNGLVVGYTRGGTASERGGATMQPLREGGADPSKPIVYKDFLAAQTEVVHHQTFAPILYVLISDDLDEQSHSTRLC
jgi:hypothetical protein